MHVDRPTHALRDLLEPAELQMLKDVGLLTEEGPGEPELPLSTICGSPEGEPDKSGSSETEAQVEREMKKRPVGRYAKYLSGGPLP